jgi:hypothetical protein
VATSPIPRTFLTKTTSGGRGELQEPDSIGGDIAHSLLIEFCTPDEAKKWPPG